jgi:hypothetical protein
MTREQVKSKKVNRRIAAHLERTLNLQKGNPSEN